MSRLIPIAALLLVTAITPGPNNLMIMRTAARDGLLRALPLMAGIVCGGAVLFVLASSGLAALLVRWPASRMAVALAGGAYLVWLGVHLAMARADAMRSLPESAPGFFGFQFLNAKAWAMAVTVIAALPDDSIVPKLITVLPLFAGISSGCLMVWAGLGRALSPVMADTVVRARIDRVLGALLVASALLLFASPSPPMATT